MLATISLFPVLMSYRESMLSDRETRILLAFGISTMSVISGNFPASNCVCMCVCVHKYVDTEVVKPWDFT